MGTSSASLSCIDINLPLSDLIYRLAPYGECLTCSDKLDKRDKPDKREKLDKWDTLGHMFCVEHSCSDTSSIIKRRKRSRSALCGIERCREHISGQAKGSGGYDADVWWSGQRTNTAYRLTALTKREPGLSGFRKSLSRFRT